MSLLLNRKTTKNKGFTLIEVMIALIVFAFLLVMAMPSLNAKAKRKMEMQNEILSYVCDDISPNCMACKLGKCIACTNSCGNSYYLNVEDCTCLTCEKNCTGCDKDKCINCEKGYILKEGKCFKDNNYSLGSTQKKVQQKTQQNVTEQVVTILEDKGIPKEVAQSAVKQADEMINSPELTQEDIQKMYEQLGSEQGLEDLMEQLKTLTKELESLN